MKVFISGAAGFLGSHLVEYFLKEGHSVVGVDDLSGGSLDNLNFVEWNFKTKTMPTGDMLVAKDKVWWKEGGKNFEFFKADCRDFDEMLECMKDVDLVYHCACHAQEGLSVFSPSFITNSVYSGSVAVFSAAIQAGVKRIIYLSSMARYGNGIFISPEGHMTTLEKYGKALQKCNPSADLTKFYSFSEDLIPSPVDPYGISKVAAEDTLKLLADVHGIEYTIVIPHNIIGLRQCLTDPTRNVVSIFMNRLKQGKEVIIYGDGSQTRCFSPVADCISCLARLADLSDKSVVGEVINIGPDKGGITIGDLAERLYVLAGKSCNPQYVPSRPCEVKVATCNSDKARKLLGYKEQQSLDECLLRMWNAIPDGGIPFVYDNKPLEIINEKTPKTWTDKLI